jgi:lipopolysaccharide/colanic/teichoic acid biosynthesis glycosyltransferase
VNSGYGSSVDDARTKLSYDLFYVKHQSLSLDLVILARTVMAVLSLGGR